MSLGQDFAADALAAFSGELYDATLTRFAETGYDVDDPAGAPTGASTEYDCEGIAFDYEQSYIDGSRVMRGDYRVVILRGSLAIVPAPGDVMSIPPPNETVAKSARVIAVEAVTEAQVTLHVRGVLA
jgi:hypothetical protein